MLNARASACLIFIASLFMYVVILVKLAIIRAFVETHGILWEFTIKSISVISKFILPKINS